ncbi:MAG: hypothetical protein PHG20_10210, partial [Geobacteraceae bacterium]|nr:hypothetical protein [Geobacteraceae bacterium]
IARVRPSLMSGSIRKRGRRWQWRRHNFAEAGMKYFWNFFLPFLSNGAETGVSGPECKEE